MERCRAHRVDAQHIGSRVRRALRRAVLYSNVSCCVALRRIARRTKGRTSAPTSGRAWASTTAARWGSAWAATSDDRRDAVGNSARGRRATGRFTPACRQQHHRHSKESAHAPPHHRAPRNTAIHHFVPNAKESRRFLKVVAHPVRWLPTECGCFCAHPAMFGHGHVARPPCRPGLALRQG